MSKIKIVNVVGRNYVIWLKVLKNLELNPIIFLGLGLLPLKEKYSGGEVGLELQSATEARKGLNFYAVPNSYRIAGSDS